jgi:hypothetical protein
MSWICPHLRGDQCAKRGCQCKPGAEGCVLRESLEGAKARIMPPPKLSGDKKKRRRE